MRAKSKQDEVVKRRVRAGRLLLAGKSPPEVARTVGAPRQTVYRWHAVLEAGGIDALRTKITTIVGARTCRWPWTALKRDRSNRPSKAR